MWPYPKVLAHRGGGKLAPENTIAALRCGLAHGFRAVEFDVMLTQDEVPVLMHDPEFGRTVAGSGSVAQTRSQDLLQMDAGRWFGAGFEGETVPAFASVLEFCQQNGIWMNIEIKPAPGHETRTGAVVAEMTQRSFAGRPRQEWPLLSSFSMPALAAAMAGAPALPRALLLDKLDDESGNEAGKEAGNQSGNELGKESDNGSGNTWLILARQLQAVAVHTNQKHLTAPLANAVKQAGLGLFCYTVNEPARASQLLAWGVDAFCTDRIDLIGPAYPL